MFGGRPRRGSACTCRPDPHGQRSFRPILARTVESPDGSFDTNARASLSGLEFTLPPSQPLTPPAHPLPLCIDLTLSSCDLRLSDCELFGGTLSEHRRVISDVLAEHGDEFAVDEQGDGSTHRDPTDSQYRLHVDHFAAAAGTRTVRYASSLPRPASSLRSILANMPRVHAHQRHLDVHM